MSKWWGPCLQNSCLPALVMRSRELLRPSRRSHKCQLPEEAQSVSLEAPGWPSWPSIIAWCYDVGKEHNGTSDCLGSNYCINTEKKVTYGLMIFLGSQELKPRAVFFFYTFKYSNLWDTIARRGEEEALLLMDSSTSVSTIASCLRMISS